MITEAELDDIVTSADADEAKVFQGIKMIRETMRGGMRPAAMFECLRLFTEVAQTIADSGEMAEVLDHEITFPEDFLAQLIIVHLPNPDENLTIGDKERWLRVAHWMGPDWVSSFTKTGAFMRKVEGF